MADGFSHGFDRLDANRELVTWMRAYNQTRASDMTLAFYGFDGPCEVTHAASPRRYLEQLHTYLTSNLGAEAVLHQRDALDRPLSDDQRWNNPAAQMDAAQSLGASPEATALRAIADDLLTTLHLAGNYSSTAAIRCERSSSTNRAPNRVPSVVA
jgi:erythromycin esterase-like protein